MPIAPEGRFPIRESKMRKEPNLITIDQFCESFRFRVASIPTRKDGDRWLLQSKYQSHKRLSVRMRNHNLRA